MIYISYVVILENMGTFVLAIHLNSALKTPSVALRAKLKRTILYCDTDLTLLIQLFPVQPSTQRGQTHVSYIGLQ
jgi:hypothetical protein